MKNIILIMTLWAAIMASPEMSEIETEPLPPSPPNCDVIVTVPMVIHAGCSGKVTFTNNVKRSQVQIYPAEGVVMTLEGGE